MKAIRNLTNLPARWLVLIIVLPLLALVEAVQAQNVTIYSWTPPGSVRSEDVRIRHTSTTLSDLFDAGIPEVISLIKSENAIYARFHNNSEGLDIIPDGAVTVTAEYAEEEPGIAPGNLASTAAAITSWNTIGSYVMDLEILPIDPPGYGLLPGSSYPTSREVGIPSRYQILCSSNCDKPLPTAFFLRVSLSLAGDTNPDDNVAYSYYDLTEGAPPADVVILHDVSGSMIGELPAAKERAKMFVDLLNKGDRVGVVAFSTQFTGYTQIKASLGTITTIYPTDDVKTFAKNGIDSFTASGATPMGSGVLKAQEVLNAVSPPYPSKRAIVMLTDGKENRDPRLQDPPTYPILTGLNTDANGSIALYPLWFGTMSHWGKTLLEDIINHVDKGKVVDQPDDDLKLAEAYLLIRGILASDDIYAIHRGTSGDGYEGAINVDAVTNELILTTAWKTFQRDLDISVLPPGSSSWQCASSLAASTSRGQLYVVQRFQNPQSGQWRYRLSRTPKGEPYVLAAIADKVEILMQSSLADATVAAGEPLIINAKFSRNGKPVSGGTVQATVAVPEKSLGTILHDYRDRLKTPWPPDPASEVTRAPGIIKELKEFLGSDQIFTYEPKTVVLRDDDGDGTYTGSFKETQVAGTYRVRITAKGVSKTTGERFRREHRHAAVVSLGRIDPDRSIIEIALQNRVGERGATIWRVNVIPVDVYGNFVDPGYSGRIHVKATGGKWLRELIDNEDGSYTRFLQLEAGETAQIVVTAFGKSLPKRDVTEEGPKKWQVSLHAGAVYPTGSLNDDIDSGASFTLDLGYRFQPRLTALFLLGTHEFSEERGGTERVWQLSANLRAHLSNTGLSPYIQGGAGVYKIFHDWEGGLNIGAGLIYPASTQIDIEGGVDLNNIFLGGDDAQFWRAQIGFSIRF